MNNRPDNYWPGTPSGWQGEGPAHPPSWVGIAAIAVVAVALLALAFSTVRDEGVFEAQAAEVRP